MNIIIQKEVHASTNPYRTVCNLPLTKKCKPVGGKEITCSTCAAKETQRTNDIRQYIQKLLADESLPIDQRMWKLVGYVEQTLREI